MSRRRHDLAAVLLAVTVVGTAVVLVSGFRVASPERAAGVGLACAALATVVVVPGLRRALTLPMVLTATLVLLTIAVAAPPAETHDLYSYAMDGRIVAHYGDSPYTHAPSDYPHDPLLREVASGWRHTPSLYGPAFTAASAGIASVAGTDVLANRLGFQLLAAACVLALLLVLYRRTRDPVVVALVGCNPVVLIEVVNAGRNDALVALALLAGILLATRRRLVAAAAVVALGALVKISVVVALGALLVWTWRRYGSRITAAAGAAAAAVLVVPYAIVGGMRALEPVTEAANRMSRASIWQVTRRDGLEHLLGLHNAARVGAVLGTVGPAAVVGVVGLAALLSLSRLADPSPELVALGAIAGFLLLGSYVLASYAMWALPLAAWRYRAGVSRAVLAWSALLTVAYQAVRPMPTAVGDLAVWLVSGVTLLFAVVSIMALAVAAVKRLRPSSTRDLGPTATRPVPVAP
jgi:Glycosyltransferase family 87